MKVFQTAFLAIAFAASMPVAAQPARAPQTLQQGVEQRLQAAGPGVRFGLVVAAEDGREVVAIAPDGRFIPASNTKLFTTAAAFATLTDLDRPDSAGGASVTLETERGAAPDVVLEGFGDAGLGKRVEKEVGREARVGSPPADLGKGSQARALGGGNPKAAGAAILRGRVRKARRESPGSAGRGSHGPGPLP